MPEERTSSSSESSVPPRLRDVPSSHLQIVIEALKRRFPPPKLDPKLVATDEGRAELCAAMAHQEVIKELEAALAVQRQQARGVT